MPPKLIIFFLSAILLFGASLLTERYALQEASNISHKFKSQLKLINLSKNLEYEIERHQADMLESIITDQSIMQKNQHDVTIKKIIDELKACPHVKNKESFQDIVSTLNARYEGFKAVEASLITAIKSKNIEDIQDALFGYNEITNKFSGDSKKLASLIDICVDRNLLELEEKSSNANIYTILSALIAAIILIYSFIKLVMINKEYQIEKAHALEAEDEQRRLKDELKYYTQSLEIEVDKKTHELKDKVIALEEATKIKSEFLANMSHEIRTPMNAILGFIQILERQEEDSDKLRKFHVIKSAATSLLKIINDILDFSKIESGKLEIENIKVNTKKPFKEVAKLFFMKANEKNINISYSFDDKLPRFIISDPTRIKQIVTNILNNAIKFTPVNGSIKMRVECDEYQKVLTCRVFDNGIGISHDNLEKIFGAFNQEDNSTTRKYGGTGLGLSISRDLVALMGGKIGVSSQEGQGSEFYFEIPIKTD